MANRVEQADESGAVKIFGIDVRGQGHLQSSDDSFYERQELLDQAGLGFITGGFAAVAAPERSFLGGADLFLFFVERDVEHHNGWFKG